MRNLRYLIATISVLLVACSSVQAQPPGGGADPWPGMKKLLVVADVTTGYHHDSINHAMAVIEQLGRESGAWVTFIRTDSQLITKEPIVGQGTRYGGRSVNAKNLDFFDGVFFLGAGEGTLNEEQMGSLLSFVRDDGKGVMLGHAGSIFWYEWEEYQHMIGSFMSSEFSGEAGYIRESSTFPGATAFPETFTYNDQPAVWMDYFSSDDAEVILRVDPATISERNLERRPDGDLPQVFAKYYGQGRVFNNALGHNEVMWDDPRFRELMTEGIKWALGATDYQLHYPNMPTD